MSAPRFVELICQSGACGVPAMPVVVRLGAITGPPVPPLDTTTDGMNGTSNVGGKWYAPSVSTVRDDSGAWLFEKNAVVRARLMAMLSSSCTKLLAVLATPSS